MLQQPCWWTRTKEFLSTENYTIFCGNSSKNVYYFVHYAGLVVTWLETKNFSTCHRVKHMKTREDRPLKYKYGFTGADPGTFGWGGPNFGSEWLLNFFVTCWESRDDHMFLNLWTPFTVGAGNTALRAEANRSWGYPKTITLHSKSNLHFIKKISQSESDIWSCQCKSFSFKQASDLIAPSPWIRQSVLVTLLPSRMCVM